MLSCIYCGHNFPQLTEEHVISAALGCKEILHEAVCKACNDKFGHSLEAPLIRGLGLFLNSLRIPGRDGRVPDYKCQGTVDGKPVEITYAGHGRIRIPP